MTLDYSFLTLYAALVADSKKVLIFYNLYFHDFLGVNIICFRKYQFSHNRNTFQRHSIYVLNSSSDGHSKENPNFPHLIKIHMQILKIKCVPSCRISHSRAYFYKLSIIYSLSKKTFISSQRLWFALPALKYYYYIII